MRRPLIATVGSVLVAACGLARAASWTVVAQPGDYGRVAIGGYVEAPRVYVPQPLVAFTDRYGRTVEEYIDPAFGTEQMPVYLWVPEAQRLHWAESCRDYGACGVPVYFVEDRWYRENVLRRNWTPEQRAWTTAQWLEQDRVARERVERQRFEQQRAEAQRRWAASEHAWGDPVQRAVEQQALAGQAEREEHASESRWSRIRSFFFGRTTQAQAQAPAPVPVQAAATASAPQANATAMGMNDRREERGRSRGEATGFERGGRQR